MPQSHAVLGGGRLGARSDGSPRRPRREADLTAVAWVAGSELTYDDWIRHGGRPASRAEARDGGSVTGCGTARPGTGSDTPSRPESPDTPTRH